MSHDLPFENSALICRASMCDQELATNPQDGLKLRNERRGPQLMKRASSGKECSVLGRKCQVLAGILFSVGAGIASDVEERLLCLGQ